MYSLLADFTLIVSILILVNPIFFKNKLSDLIIDLFGSSFQGDAYKTKLSDFNEVGISIMLALRYVITIIFIFVESIFAGLISPILVPVLVLGFVLYYINNRSK